MFFIILLVIAFVQSFQTPDFFCDYVEVDKENQANVFYWMYGSDRLTRDEDPVIIWLQGGPGGSSMNGDICEIGPLDYGCDQMSGEMKPRKFNWASFSNLFFIDQPVGTGFSYVMNKEGYTHSEKQIDEELLMTVKAIFNEFPHLRKNPFYIFSESYGGKMTSSFSRRLLKAIANKEIDINFKGIGLGDSWISPIDCMKSYSPFLLAQSHFDDLEAEKSNEFAIAAEKALKAGQGQKATDIWGAQSTYISEKTELNFYNILKHTYPSESNITTFVNTELRKKFKIIPDHVKWSFSNGEVFENLEGDFMYDVIDAVDFALDNGLKVVVYSGMLDLIVNTLCTEAWMQKLNWKGLEQWKATPKELIKVGTNVGFVKRYQNLELWLISNAGHMVPQDNGELAFKMVTSIFEINLFGFSYCTIR